MNDTFTIYSYFRHYHMYFVMIFTYYDITKAQIELLFCAVTTTYYDVI